MFCTLAASGQIVRVPAEGLFVCPQCGKTLVSPTAPTRGRRSSGVGWTLIMGLLLVVVGFLGGTWIGGLFSWPWPGHIEPLASRALHVSTEQVLIEPLATPDPVELRLHGQARRRPAVPPPAPRAEPQGSLNDLIPN